jgi:hypothetical protein
MVSPPAPIPDPQQRGSNYNALMVPQQQMQRMPAPSHQQTCAALRQFMAIIGELKTLWKNPDLGRSSIKSAIIDGTTKLVGERVIGPASAVVQLASVPEDPLAQRKWVTTMLQQTVKAQNNVLDHHVATHPGTLDWNTESQHAPYNRDDHLAIMDGLAGHYRPVA